MPCTFLTSASTWVLPSAGVRPTVLQFQMAHLVPLKPYAAPVPRSQSLCDQPTKTMSAFPTQDPSLTPTPRPIHSRELVRQNSDPTSETPAPQTHQVREDPGPWIRLPDVELPPKVSLVYASAPRRRCGHSVDAEQGKKLHTWPGVHLQGILTTR